jgi:hypothetical protein
VLNQSINYVSKLGYKNIMQIIKDEQSKLDLVVVLLLLGGIIMIGDCILIDYIG